MEQLEKLYQAVKMFEELGLPISLEQKIELAKLENEYIEKQIIPLLEETLQSKVGQMHNSFNLLVTYTPADGLTIKTIERKIVKQPTLFESEKDTSYKSKQGYLRVTFPDGRVVQESIVNKTLIEVVEYAGPNRVQDLNILCGGDNLIRDEIAQDEKRPISLKRLSTGQVIQTNSPTKIKMEQIKYINKKLNLGLIVEHIK